MSANRLSRRQWDSQINGCSVFCFEQLRQGCLELRNFKDIQHGIQQRIGVMKNLGYIKHVKHAKIIKEQPDI